MAFLPSAFSPSHIPVNNSMLGGGASAASQGYVMSQSNGNTYNSTAVTIDPNGKVSIKELELDGVNLKDTLAKIQERLCILVPDPVLLEKYEALQDLYSKYKTLEALCRSED